MKQHLNTLFVTTNGAYLRKDGEAVAVRIDGKVALRVPLNNIGSIVCLGRVTCSPYLLGACTQRGIAVSLLTENGRFLAAVNGFTPGNVLLRREQYRRADDLTKAAEIARACVIGKLANYRTVLRRAARERDQQDVRLALTRAADRIDISLRRLQKPAELDSVRGLEGEASNVYFGVFNHLLTAQHDDFRFTTRSRRPPLDPVNALLSFLYTVLAHDVRSACEAIWTLTRPLSGSRRENWR